MSTFSNVGCGMNVNVDSHLSCQNNQSFADKTVSTTDVSSSMTEREAPRKAVVPWTWREHKRRAEIRNTLSVKARDTCAAGPAVENLEDEDASPDAEGKRLPFPMKKIISGGISRERGEKPLSEEMPYSARKLRATQISREKPLPPARLQTDGFTLSGMQAVMRASIRNSVQNKRTQLLKEAFSPAPGEVLDSRYVADKAHRFHVFPDQFVMDGIRCPLVIDDTEFDFRDLDTDGYASAESRAERDERLGVLLEKLHQLCRGDCELITQVCKFAHQGYMDCFVRMLDEGYLEMEELPSYAKGFIMPGAKPSIRLCEAGQAGVRVEYRLDYPEPEHFYRYLLNDAGREGEVIELDPAKSAASFCYALSVRRSPTTAGGFEWAVPKDVKAGSS